MGRGRREYRVVGHSGRSDTLADHQSHASLTNPPI